MAALYDFLKRFANIGDAGQGSLDEIRWVSAGVDGTDLAVVPRGAGIFVRGWALDVDGSQAARSVMISVDGERKYQARVGLARPDVANSLGNPSLDRAGFESIVPTGQLDLGPHELSVRVVDTESRTFAVIAPSVTFSVLGSDRDLPQGVAFGDARCDVHIDEVFDVSQDRPIDVDRGSIGVSRGSFVRIRGWAYDVTSREPVSSIFGLLDGRLAFAGKYGIDRPDVGATRGIPGLTAVGFIVDLPTIELQRGDYQLEIVALATAKDALLRSNGSLKVTVHERAARPRELARTTAAYLDSVVRVTKTAEQRDFAPLRVARGDDVFVRGWAIDEETQAPAGGVVFIIDNDIEIPALYGLHRPDVAEFLGNPSLTRCGFSAEISTSAVPPGRHSARCYVIASDGRGTLRTAQQFEFEVIE